jgi:spore coat polysaccharide biosynthesis protein SpsF
MELAGRPVIDHVVKRCRAALSVDRVVVALPDASVDDSLYQWCVDNEVPCVRGSTEDVLSRYIKALNAFPCRTMVRITADCPLVDPGLIDSLLFMHAAMGNDYTSNVGPPDFPKGFDIEVVGADVLRRVDSIAQLQPHREHVTLYVRERPGEFKSGSMSYGLAMPDIRLTLDRLEDYQALQMIFDKLVSRQPLCSLYEILTFLHEHPEILALNSAGVPFKLPTGFAQGR